MTNDSRTAVLFFDGEVAPELVALSNQIKNSPPPLYQTGDLVIVPPGRCAVVRFVSQDIHDEYFPSTLWIYAVTKRDLRGFDYHPEDLVVPIH